MGQSRRTGLSLFSLENRVARGIDIGNVISQFANLKSRRVNFYAMSYEILLHPVLCSLQACYKLTFNRSRRSNF